MQYNTCINKPIVKLNYDEGKIKKLLNQWGKQDSNLFQRLENNLPPEISTEYYCKPVEKDGKVLQINIHNAKMEPIYEGIAIVDFGNCNSNHCQFQIVENSQRMNEYDTSRPGHWITKGGKNIEKN